jgi:hypothetical protein
MQGTRRQAHQKIVHAGTAFGGGDGLEEAWHAGLLQGRQTAFGPDVLPCGLLAASVMSWRASLLLCWLDGLLP